MKTVSLKCPDALQGQLNECLISSENDAQDEKRFAQMNEKIYEYDAVIQVSEAGKGGAYVIFPYDLREEFGKGRVKIHASFAGEPYDGSIVNMGVKNPDGSVCYILGILKDIRAKIGKQPGDTVRVKVQARE